LLRVGVLQAVAEGGGAAGCRHGLDCRRDGACRSKPTRHRSRLVQRSGLLAPRRSRQPALLRCLPSAPLAPCAAFRTRCRCALLVAWGQLGSSWLNSARPGSPHLPVWTAATCLASPYRFPPHGRQRCAATAPGLAPPPASWQSRALTVVLFSRQVDGGARVVEEADGIDALEQVALLPDSPRRRCLAARVPISLVWPQPAPAHSQARV
jgi:hypothetical protein